jgi:tetratricopeptide (TPR) repeat protein
MKPAKDSELAGANRRAMSAAGNVTLVLDAAAAAERMLEQETRRHPSYADVHHRLGLLRMLRRDLPAAEREFEEALGINPGYRAAYYGLRLVRLLRGAAVPEIAPPQGAAAAVMGRKEAAWRRIDAAYRALVAGDDPLAQLTPATDGVDPQLADHYAGAFAAQMGRWADARAHWTAAAERRATTREALTVLGLWPWPEEADGGMSARLAEVLWTPLAEDLYADLARVCARSGGPRSRASLAASGRPSRC